MEKLDLKIFDTLKRQEAKFSLERNKHAFEKVSLEKALEAIAQELENVKNEKRCLEAERDSVRKHYRDFVQLMRPDIIETQSGKKFKIRNITNLKYMN